MGGLPYQGNPGVFNYNGNPTLIPNFYKNSMSLNNTLDALSPAAFIAANPRVAATATATIGGSITNTDTVTLTLTQAQLPNGAISYTHTVVTSESVQTVAAALATGFNAALTAANIPSVYAATGDTTFAGEAVITVNWAGQMGNSAVLSYTKSGGATETVTLSPVSGVLSGGTGPIYVVNNFTFSYNSCTLTFVAGNLVPVDSGLAAVLAAQDMPVL